eukprot:480832_1
MEVSFITQLKSWYTYHETSQLSDMFSDYSRSMDLSQQFQKCYQSHNSDNKIQYTTYICTHGAWPQFDNESEIIIIDNDIALLVSNFCSFYHKQYKFSNRKLIPHRKYGRGRISIQFNKE